MKKLAHWSNDNNSCYENGSEILPNKGEKIYYGLLEVEFFKIIIK